MIKAVIFDLDGTLLYTLPDLTAAMNHAMKTHGYPEITVKDTERFIGNGVKKYTERALGDGADEKTVLSCLSAFKEYYKNNNVVYTEPYGGIIGLLDELKGKGIKLAVQSNKYDEATKFIIEHYFPAVFDSVYGECELCPRKPDPKGTHLILGELGVSADETLFIGDSGADISAAKNSGCIPVSVTWGYRDRASLEKSGAETFVSSPEEIKNLIFGE